MNASIKKILCVNERDFFVVQSFSSNSKFVFPDTCAAQVSFTLLLLSAYRKHFLVPSTIAPLTKIVFNYRETKRPFQEATVSFEDYP